MGSINAQRAAQKVYANIRMGKKVVMSDIVKEAGYAPSIARHPSHVTRTKSFQKALDVERRPILDGLQAQINRIKDALAKKDMNAEETRVLVGSLDILIKNYQLLSGGATERQVFVLPSEVIDSNKIATTEEKPLLKDGSTEPPNS